MKLIDVYLGRHGKKRYDVFKETGLSQQTLASANGKPAASLTGRILQAIGRTVGETPGRVLDEMLKIEQEGFAMTVTTKEELLAALKGSADRIEVRGGLRADVMKLGRRMYQADYSGLTPGSVLLIGVGTPLLEKLCNVLLALFRDETEEEKANLKIADRLRYYNLHIVEGEDGHQNMQLVSKQLEYLDGKGNL